MQPLWWWSNPEVLELFSTESNKILTNDLFRLSKIHIHVKQMISIILSKLLKNEEFNMFSVVTISRWPSKTSNDIAI